MPVLRQEFRNVKDISPKLIECEELRWHLPETNQEVIFTLDGRHFGFATDVGALSGIWQPTADLCFRPIGLTWKQAADLAYE